MAFIYPAVRRSLGRAEHGSIVSRGTLRSDTVKFHDGSAEKNTIFRSLFPRVIRTSIAFESSGQVGPSDMDFSNSFNSNHCCLADGRRDNDHGNG